MSVHPPTLLPPPPPQVVPSYSYVLPNSPNSGFVCTVIRFPSDSSRGLTLLFYYTLSSSYYSLHFWHTLLSCPLLPEVLLRTILYQLWRRPPKPGEMEQKMLLLLSSWIVLRSRTFNVYWTYMSTVVQALTPLAPSSIHTCRSHWRNNHCIFTARNVLWWVMFSVVFISLSTRATC